MSATWDMEKVIPGELADEVEDIAPGVVEYVAPRTPVVRQAGAAAMVAASVTGRAAGLTARHGWAVARWFGAGVAGVSVLGYRYVRAHDRQEVLGGMSKDADWNKIENTRKLRWKFLGRIALSAAGFDLAGWWSLVKFGGLTALDWSWAVTPGFETLTAAALVTGYGRYRMSRPGLAPQQFLADEDTDDGEEPFPLGMCRTPMDVTECVGRALAWESVATRRIDVLGHRGWGWEIAIDLKGSTAGKVNAVADQLDAHFNIKKGGTLIDPDPQQSAHITLRLVTDNPFAGMGQAEVHAPNSLDIADAHHFGMCMDGTPLEMVLEGQRIIVIGVSGAAKSTGVLRDLAEVVTACHNAIAIEMDPVKDGLREFEGVMAAPPIRGPKACETWLGYLLKMAKARNTVRNRLNMGDTWKATAKHPAIFVFADEFIYLSKKAKGQFIELLRIGKQSGIYVVAAGQDATSDSMGDAIADSFTTAVMLAARHADIPLVLGQGAIAAGFRPDRLVPALNDTIVNDAGQSYIKAPGLTRPLLYGWNRRSRSSIKQAVEDRKTAGRPWFDQDTLVAAGLQTLTQGAAGDGGSAQLVPDVIEVMTSEGVDRMKTEALVDALFGYDPNAYDGLTVDDLRKGLKAAGAGSPVTLGPIGDEKNPRGYKLDTLTELD